MHVILTHEQADFDALASLLGAYLLDDAAVPVLPRRVNRNVGAYVTLYGLELPFVDPRDLPKRRVDTITLVDTQSMVTIKGMHSKTRIHVIDHHTPRADLPEEWTIQVEEIGATSTLFVESIQSHNGPLTTIQATLLLLGIYEDTGSLTYTRTTPRDIRAAAYLLEQGASLQIAGEFLNHPLSLDQQRLYEHLRDTIETYEIKGHTILIARGDATDMDEELSTLAHRLRDLLDPDALFLLVTTRGGVQFIARSTSDYIDVAEVAALFGGGGHPRAAAARVRNEEIQVLFDKLVKNLPRLVQPAITVAEIMSRSPQTLSLQTSVQEVSNHMRRYGYEGFPVVANDKVVGLLTRRAVDRALEHNLNLSAGELMQAGEVSISPDESVENLQNMMIETGWGQIPVVSSETSAIIGIVTRTDLIKTLTPPSVASSRQNLSDRLEHILPRTQLALLKAVAEVAYTQRAALYIVGGFVRDLIVERPSLDYDLVVEGDAIALSNSLVEKYGGRAVTHKRFGTAKWQVLEIREELTQHLENEVNTSLDSADLPNTLDLVSARREFYTHPTALPTVERGSIKLDLHRRDFTINTLALRLDGRHYGQLHDYWGGVNDLQSGLIRVLHSLSFVDDPTRILRAVRFESRFAFGIETRTLELLHAALPLLDRVSGDRIRHELNNVFLEDNYLQMLERMHELGILSAIHPALVWNSEVQTHLEMLKELQPEPVWELEDVFDSHTLYKYLGYILWLSCLPSENASSISERLRLPQVVDTSLRTTCHLVKELGVQEKLRPSVVLAKLEKTSSLTRYAVYILSEDDNIRQAVLKCVREWQHVSPITSGHDLRAFGLRPSPAYKLILTQLRDAWVDGEVKNFEQEKALLEKLMAQYQ
jgi:tRNA nucleotidyltransferase (CCA-adding enzyme)